MNEVTLINGLIVAFAVAMVSLPVLLTVLGVCCVFHKAEK